jgi:hypothetical protein
MSRTRSAALSALAALAVVSAAPPALAQGTDEFGAYGGTERRGRFESPQQFAFEMRFGRYLPNVDDEFDGATPFRDIFGDDMRFLVGVELDWQALRIPGFGSLGPGFGWGFTTMSAPAPLTNGTGFAEQETSLTIMPMYAVGVLRVDVLAQEANIPLAGYAKLGVGVAPWWVGDGAETAHDDQGKIGRDISYGWQYALGGMLLLDFFDPGAALEIDNTIGVNNSYFFAEWYVSQLDGFGGGKMNVGTNTWMIGLCLEI